MEMNGGLTQTEPGHVTGESARAVEKPIACIDLDRFCEECSYNLRTLPVVRDSYTGIPVVRCTECGNFQPANDASTALRPWLSNPLKKCSAAPCGRRNAALGATHEGWRYAQNGVDAFFNGLLGV